MHSMISSATSTESPKSPKTKSNEWFTPSYLIEAARAVMGSIDLDPASCALANETVKAARYFTEDDDGLSKAWGNIEQPSRVWCNPPYGKAAGIGYIACWINKAIEEYSIGNVKEAIMLVTGDTDTRWFQRLLDYPTCFADHAISFLHPDDNGIVCKGKYSGHIFGTCFAYLGSSEASFIEVFQQFGTVARRIAPQS